MTMQRLTVRAFGGPEQLTVEKVTEALVPGPAVQGPVLPDHDPSANTARAWFLLIAMPTSPCTCLPHFDNDLSFGTSRFDVSHRLVCRFKRKYPVHDRANEPGTNKRADLA